MPSFKPYEAHIRLPQHHIYASSDLKCLLRGSWDLRSEKKTVLGSDPYDLGYRVWLRLREIRKLCGSLDRSNIYLQYRLRHKEGVVHAFSKDEVQNIVCAMKPSILYNPFRFDCSIFKNFADPKVEDTTLYFLSCYAKEHNIFTVYRTDFSSGILSMWHDTKNLTIWQIGPESFKIWSTNSGLNYIQGTENLIQKSLEELRGFC